MPNRVEIFKEAERTGLPMCEVEKRYLWQKDLIFWGLITKKEYLNKGV